MVKASVSLRKSLKFLLGNKLYIAAYNKLFTRNNKLLNEDFYEFDYKAVYGDREAEVLRDSKRC